MRTHIVIANTDSRAETQLTPEAPAILDPNANLGFYGMDGLEAEVEHRRRQILFNHASSPRNGILLLNATHRASLVHPRCGDRVQIHLRVVGTVIVAAGFAAHGCSICTASASLMCETVSGQIVDEAAHLPRQVSETIAAPLEAPWPVALADFACLFHLRANPSRRDCALLPWRVLATALNGDSDAG